MQKNIWAILDKDEFIAFWTSKKLEVLVFNKKKQIFFIFRKIFV